MSQTKPEVWEHKAGYRLNGDGKAIEYEHKESGLVAHLEAMVCPEEGRLEYRPAIFDGREMIEYPPVYFDKDRARDKLEEMMHEHE